MWRSLAGDEQIQDAYLPLQYLDQAVFWASAIDHPIPRRTAAISGAIVLSGRRRAAAS